MRVVRCNGCDADVGPDEWPAVAGTAVSNGTAGGPLKLKPGEEFDFCPLCTTAAFVSVTELKPLIDRMRQQKMTRNENLVGLRDYLRDQLSHDEASDLAGLEDREQTRRLVARYGREGWRVAAVALSLHLDQPAAV